MKSAALIAALALIQGLNAQHGAMFRAAGSNEATGASGFSLANNPGQIHTEKQQAGVWMQQRFTGTALNNGGLAYSARVKHSAFGADALWRGTRNFSQTRFHLSAGQEISKNFSVGFSAGITSVRQSLGFGGQQRFTGKLGAWFRINDKWDAATVLMNPWLKADALFPEGPQAAMSLGYQVNSQTRAWGHFRYNAEMESVYGMTLKHAPARNLAMVISLQSGPEPVSAGLEFSKKNLRFSLSTAYHTYLGFSPAFSCLWSVN